MDLGQAKEAYEKPSDHDHYHFSGVAIGKDMADLVEGFQWITSDDKLLSSCAVYATVTSSFSSLFLYNLLLNLQHNTSPHTKHTPSASTKAKKMQKQK